MPNKPPMKMGHSPTEMSPYKMGHSPNEMSPYKMGHSPAEMGHSPMENQNKGYSPMENQNKGYAEQERKDLIQDMPIDTRASSIINAGTRSRMGGQPKMGHSPAEMGHSPLEIEDDEEAYNRGKARREYDISKGILDPKTGKKTFKESKRKQKVFVTKMGKVLPVGSKAQ